MGDQSPTASTGRSSGKRGGPSITRRVNAIIVTSLFLGIGGLTVYFALTQFASIRRDMESNLDRQAQNMYVAIQNFMIPGQAAYAVNYFRQMSEDEESAYRILLFRVNGTMAFSDNSTIAGVNSRLGRDQFSVRESPVFPVSAAREPEFGIAAGTSGGIPDSSTFEEREEARTSFVVYKPLYNLPTCSGCHGSDHSVRGVLSISSDITAGVRRQYETLAVALALFLGILVVLAVVITQYLRGAVIRPVQVIGEICRRVTDGDFESRVASGGRDEIGRLGETVNRMVEGLHERFELQKFVSSSTMKSLHLKKEGKRTALTLMFTDIRGFTAYSERTEPEAVVGHLNRVLSEQTDFVHANGGDVDKYVGDEVVALFAENEPEIAACRTALAIQARLKELGAEIDGLSVGIGINTGDVILGMIGSEKRADFTVIGDNVNTASRLCNAAKPGQIIVSRAVYEKTKDKITIEGPYRLRVKGKTEPLIVFVLAGMKEEAAS